MSGLKPFHNHPNNVQSVADHTAFQTNLYDLAAYQGVTSRHLQGIPSATVMAASGAAVVTTFPGSKGEANIYSCGGFGSGPTATAGIASIDSFFGKVLDIFTFNGVITLTTANPQDITRDNQGFTWVLFQHPFSGSPNGLCKFDVPGKRLVAQDVTVDHFDRLYFDPYGNRLYVWDSTGINHTGIYQVDLTTLSLTLVLDLQFIGVSTTASVIFSNPFGVWALTQDSGFLPPVNTLLMLTGGGQVSQIPLNTDVSLTIGRTKVAWDSQNRVFILWQWPDGLGGEIDGVRVIDLNSGLVLKTFTDGAVFSSVGKLSFCQETNSFGIWTGAVNAPTDAQLRWYSADRFIFKGAETRDPFFNSQNNMSQIFTTNFGQSVVLDGTLYAGYNRGVLFMFSDTLNPEHRISDGFNFSQQGYQTVNVKTASVSLTETVLIPDPLIQDKQNPYRKLFKELIPVPDVANLKVVKYLSDQVRVADEVTHLTFRPGDHIPPLERGSWNSGLKAVHWNFQDTHKFFYPLNLSYSWHQGYRESVPTVDYLTASPSHIPPARPPALIQKTVSTFSNFANIGALPQNSCLSRNDDFLVIDQGQASVNGSIRVMSVNPLTSGTGSPASDINYEFGLSTNGPFKYFARDVQTDGINIYATGNTARADYVGDGISIWGFGPASPPSTYQNGVAVGALTLLNFNSSSHGVFNRIFFNRLTGELFGWLMAKGSSSPVYKINPYTLEFTKIFTPGAGEPQPSTVWNILPIQDDILLVMSRWETNHTTTVLRKGKYANTRRFDTVINPVVADLSFSGHTVFWPSVVTDSVDTAWVSNPTNGYLQKYNLSSGQMVASYNASGFLTANTENGGDAADSSDQYRYTETLAFDPVAHRLYGTPYPYSPFTGLPLGGGPPNKLWIFDPDNLRLLQQYSITGGRTQGSIGVRANGQFWTYHQSTISVPDPSFYYEADKNKEVADL